jgi:hypothetical protein
MKKELMLKNLQKLNEKQMLMWALGQVLPDIVMAFCLSLIVTKTAPQKLLLTTACEKTLLSFLIKLHY